MANLYIVAFVPCLCNMDERNYRNEGGELHRTKEAKCAADAHFVLSGVFLQPIFDNVVIHILYFTCHIIC